MLLPFLAAAVGLEGCAAVVLPVGGATVTLVAVLFAAALAVGLVGAVVGLDMVAAGRDVDGAVAGLEEHERKIVHYFIV